MGRRNGAFPFAAAARISTTGGPARCTARSPRRPPPDPKVCVMPWQCVDAGWGRGSVYIQPGRCGSASVGSAPAGGSGSTHVAGPPATPTPTPRGARTPSRPPLPPTRSLPPRIFAFFRAGMGCETGWGEGEQKNGRYGESIGRRMDVAAAEKRTCCPHPLPPPCASPRGTARLARALASGARMKARLDPPSPPSPSPGAKRGAPDAPAPPARRRPRQGPRAPHRVSVAGCPWGAPWQAPGHAPAAPSRA